MARTTRGFMSIASICIIALFGYIGFAFISSAQSKPNININKMKLAYIKSSFISAGSDKPQSPTMPIKPITRVARAVPIPDILIAPDWRCSFDNIDEVININKSTSDEDWLKLANTEETDVSEDLDPYVYIPVEKEPYIDSKKLQKKVVYSDLAKRLGIEGKVNIRVLIGKDGIPKKNIIESSDSDLLNDAAVRAVMSSVFTPAIQDKQPIDCWMSVSIPFRLR